jgi:hypothetical protein
MFIVYHQASFGRLKSYSGEQETYDSLNSFDDDVHVKADNLVDITLL